MLEIKILLFISYVIFGIIAIFMWPIESNIFEKLQKMNKAELKKMKREEENYGVFIILFFVPLFPLFVWLFMM